MVKRNMRSTGLLWIGFWAWALVLQTGAVLAQDRLDYEQTKTIARDAYIYGFPLVMNYKTLYHYTVDTDGPEYKGPFNTVSCEARLFTPADKAVVTPNSDTPYCMFWMDLQAEPLVLSVPEIDENRYYSFQLIDFYTHNFAYVGSLTTGNKAGRYLLAGPGWDGRKPEGIDGVIRSETDLIFSVTRTQLFGPDDLENVKAIQEKYGLQPLSQYLGTGSPGKVREGEFPKWEEGAQFDERFFRYLDVALDLLGKPGKGEEELWQQLAKLDIGPGKEFRLDRLSRAQLRALHEGVKAGLEEIETFVKKNAADPLSSGKIFGTRKHLLASAAKNYGLKKPDILRAVAAHMGLYGLSASEAIYPSYLVDADGEPLDGSKHRYVLRFPKDGLPPVKAFWSLTLYDGKTQLFIENPLNRYLLNSNMMKNFRLEEDGSLSLIVSKESPGKEMEANWLPAPDGPFYLVMRLYGPEKKVLAGKWSPPKLEKMQ